METDEVRARRRHERREAAKQLDRLQLQLLAAVGERALHSDREAPGPPAFDKAAFQHVAGAQVLHLSVVY